MILINNIINWISENIYESAINWISESLYESHVNLIKIFDFNQYNINLMKMLEFDTIIIALNIGSKIISIETKKFNKNNYDEAQKTLLGRYSEIINKYNNIYKLDLIWRIVLYICLYYTSIMFNVLIANILMIMIVIPNIQNTLIDKIIKIEIVKYYLNKTKKKIIDEIDIYIRYLVAKNVISNLRNFTGLTIHNSNIFRLIQVLNWELYIECVRNLIFITGLMILRGYEMTYYYYKAIKLSYYYKTGYLINRMETPDAINFLKDLIHNKKWEHISNIEYITPLYNIIYNNVYNTVNYSVIITYGFIKYLILWSWINWLMNRNLVYISIMIITMYIKYYLKLNLDRLIIFYITLFTYYTNEFSYYVVSFCICLIFCMRNLIYTLISDTCFYIMNYKSIRAVIEHYNKQ